MQNIYDEFLISEEQSFQLDYPHGLRLFISNQQFGDQEMISE
jgi:hypothetical protein